MINLVKNALRRPYTMAIAAMLIVLMGIISVSRMIVDIFPTIDIPVVYVAWSFNGLNAEDMERRVVLVSERAYSTTVNGIDHIESLSIPGQGILKIYFQPGADIGSAIAQIDCKTIPAGPARTDCYIGLSRIYRQKSEIAAGEARQQADRAIYRQVTGSHLKPRKKRVPR